MKMGNKTVSTEVGAENGQLWYEYCYSNGERIDMSNCQE